MILSLVDLGYQLSFVYIYWFTDTTFIKKINNKLKSKKKVYMVIFNMNVYQSHSQIELEGCGLSYIITIMVNIINDHLSESIFLCLKKIVNRVTNFRI